MFTAHGSGQTVDEVDELSAEVVTVKIAFVEIICVAESGKLASVSAGRDVVITAVVVVV